MKKNLILFLLLSSATAGLSQTKIHGWVMDADSAVVPLASVRLPGLNAIQANEKGFFELVIPKKMVESHFLKPGVDLTIRVEKDGMVMLEPPEQEPTIRLPQNWTYQKPFRIYLARKGSLALLRSERMLEYILRQKIQAAVEAKEDELARRDVLAEQAQLLGLDKPALLKAVGEFKDRLRTSADLNLRGLAALDDANEAKEFKLKQQKLDSAEVNFRQAVRKAERAIREGEEEKKRVPEYYYNLGLTFFQKARYDSAAVYFAKADSAAPGDADKLNMLGRALDELAQYDKAMQVYQRAFAKDTTTFGRNHPNVAIRLNNIGEVLRAQGDYAGALEKYNEALVIDEAYFGRNHPKVAIQLNNIALVLESKGDYAGALEKYEEALKIDEVYFGRNHPDVAIDLNNIAGVLRAKGDYAGALEKYEEALKIDEVYFGRNHPNVAIQLNNIAGVLESKGDYAGALEKYNEALHIVEASFGRSHPYVATTLNNIALVLNEKGDYAGALEKYSEALAIDEAYFGRNHPNVAIRLNNIAGVLRAIGDYAGALEKYSEALAIDEAYFGRNHPKVAIRLNNIAGVLESKGDYAGALEKYNEALKIDEAYFGRNHPNVAIRLNNIAAVLESKGEYAGALEKYNEALKIDEAYFGRNHPNVAIRLNNIAGVLESKGDYAGALEKYNEALKIDEAYFGRNHPKVAIRLNNIAGVLESQGDYAGALEKYDEALAIFMQYLGSDHPNTKTVRANRDKAWRASLSEAQRWRLQTNHYLSQLSDTLNPKDQLQLLNGLGVGYIKLSQPDSGRLYLEQALPLAQKLNEQEILGTVLNNLGSSHKSLKSWAKAEQYLQQSLAHNRRVQGDSASVLAYTYFHLAGVAQAQGQTNRSREYAQKSLALVERHKLADLQKEVETLLKQKR